MRVNVNISDMVLNVSPYSIGIVSKSVQTFLASFNKTDPNTEDAISARESASFIFQVCYTYFIVKKLLMISKAQIILHRIFH